MSSLKRACGSGLAHHKRDALRSGAGRIDTVGNQFEQNDEDGEDSQPSSPWEGIGKERSQQAAGPIPVFTLNTFR